MFKLLNNNRFVVVSMTSIQLGILLIDVGTIIYYITNERCNTYKTMI